MGELFNLEREETERLRAVNPMRATLRKEQKPWVESFSTLKAGFEVQEALIRRIKETRAALAQTEVATRERPSPDDLRKNCFEPPPPFFATMLLRCRVDGIATLASGLITQVQTWAGPAEDDPALIPLSALIVFAEVPGEDDKKRARLIGWVGAEGASIGAPVMVEGGGKAFLTIPRNSQGSSAASSDVVLMRAEGDDNWREVDASSWFETLSKRLPRGLIAKQAFSLDLLGMRATTDLAREADANCCPTGGTAEVGLVLRDDALVIENLTLRKPPAQPRPASQQRRF